MCEYIYIYTLFISISLLKIEVSVLANICENFKVPIEMPREMTDTTNTIGASLDNLSLSEVREHRTQALQIIAAAKKQAGTTTLICQDRYKSTQDPD